MISIFPIKRFACVFICLIGSFIFSQDLNEEVNPQNPIRSQTKTERQRRFAMSFDIYKPIATGDNFFAESERGKTGYSLDFQLFVYKQFFLGVGLSDGYFDNTDITKSGNYKKTTLSSKDFYVGYEFLPIKNFRLGLAVTLVGDSQYRNNQSNTRKVYQVDHGRLRNYQAYFNYEIDRTLSVFIKYTYRTDKTKIQVPSQLNSYFEKTAVHQMGGGLKLYFGE